MSFSAIISVLDKLSSDVQPSPQLTYLNPDSGRYRQIANQRVSDAHGVVDRLVEVLVDILALAPYKDGSLRRSPSGGQSVKLADIAHWALAQRQTRSSSSIADQLQAFVVSNSVPMSEALVLWGLHPKAPIDLGNGIFLVPLSSLPESQPKDQLTGIKDTPYTGGTSFPAPRPSAVLKWNFVHTPVLVTQGDNPRVATKTTEMHEIAKVLCLIDDSAVCEIAHWYECDVTAPVIGGVTGWAGHTIEHAFHRQFEPRAYDETVVQDTVKKFLGLSEHVRRKFYIPLSRLNTALRRHDSAEIALELGIALEALLTPEQPDISYKVRQRGTFLLAGTPAQRKETFERLKMLYSLRSKVAHGDVLKDTLKFQGANMSTTEFLQQSRRVCAELIRAVLNNGYFIDDWDGAVLGW